MEIACQYVFCVLIIKIGMLLDIIILCLYLTSKEPVGSRVE